MYEDISIYIPASYRLLGLADADDVRDIRRRMMDDVDASIDVESRSHHTMRVLDSVWERILDVSEMIERQPDASTAAVLRCLARRPDARRTFRTGVIEMGLGSSTCRVAGVLELTPGHGRRPDRWWLAHRLIGGDGAGASTLRWTESEGTGVASLDPPFRAWIDADIDDEWAQWIHHAIGFSEPPRVETSACAMDGTLPRNVRKLAERVAELVREDLRSGPLESARLVVFRGGAIETWGVDTGTLCTVDEFIRNVTSLGPTDAAATVFPEQRRNGQGLPMETIDMSAEYRGRRWDGLWSVQRHDHGDVDLELITHFASGSVGKRGWIGVSPIDRHPFPLPSTTS